MYRRNLIMAAVVCGLIGLGVYARVAEHLPNFTPLVSIGLLAGCLLRRRAVAAAIPLSVMTLADGFFLGGYEWRVMVVVYAALALPALVRPVTRERMSAPRVGLAALGGGLAFFVATNFAHWAFMGMYELTPGGLLAAYAAGLPFLKYQIAGDLFWSAALFGGYAAARSVGHVWVRRFRISTTDATLQLPITSKA